MGLDFTKLNNIAKGTADTQTEEKPSNPPTEPFLGALEPFITLETENATESQIEGIESLSILQRRADEARADRERATAVYREYQQNIKNAGQLRAEILKGAKHGEDIYSLFLKAVQTISLMTSDNVFLSQLHEDIKAIYGEGLLEPKPLELELGEVEERLERLRTASERGTEPAESLQRIKRAIQEHEARATQLRQIIAKTQGGESLTA